LKITNQTIYGSPESIALWVFLEESLILGLANPTPESPVLKWLVNDINLEHSLTDPAKAKSQIISGDALSFLMQQVRTVPAFRMVEQKGQYYYVLVCPNFPQ